MPTDSTDSVTRVYARSLLELAEAENQLPTVAEEVEQLRALIADDADLRRLITNPILGRSDRAGMIERLFQGQVSDLTYRFLQVVNAKDRLAVLPGIAEAFGRLVAEQRNEVVVQTFVAQEMDAETKDRVSRDLGEAMGKTVTLEQHVDPSLIGGIKLRLGDRLIDASVAGQLRRMEQQLVKAGRERARAQTAAAN